jgi:DNA polymerase-3 subunit chi
MKIDFHILATDNQEQAHYFLCELMEKIYTEHACSLFLHTNTQQEAEYFDALLWTYRDESFLPHSIYSATNENLAPILIGYGEKPASHQAVLFNLGKDIPPFFQDFGHVIEIVFADPLVQQLARQRYKQYRDLGIEINTIKTSLN